MNLRTTSLIAFGVAVSAAVFVWEKDYVLSTNPISITITIQLCSIGLMAWARITFGWHSFHTCYKNG